MSFALDFREKLLQQQREALRTQKANEGFVSLPLDDSADTPRNRRRVLLALVIAGAVLAVFNSGGLVNYAYSLAGSQWGRKLVVLTERWHGMMENRHAPRVMEGIRGSVMQARYSSWGDFALELDFPPAWAAPQERPHPEVVPAGGGDPGYGEGEPPRMATPKGPVLRASAEKRN